MNIQAINPLTSPKPGQGALAQGDVVRLLRTDPAHMGLDGTAKPDSEAGPASFENYQLIRLRFIPSIYFF